MNLSPIRPVGPPAADAQRVQPQTPRFEPASAPDRGEPTGASKAAIAFESVVLRTFVEAMLPKEAFGEGTAGHMWRGQMADALADTLARSGGIGLAATLEETR